MREGTTTRDAFFRFLQTAKRLSAGEEPRPFTFADALIDAVQRAAPGADPAKHLSSSVDDRFLSRAWRAFWFGWVATPDVLVPWVRSGTGYAVPGAVTRVLKDDGSGFSQQFEGRESSLKNVIVADLNAGRISETQAWDNYVSGFSRPGRHISGSGKKTLGIAGRAHSYREDLDTALAQLELIDMDGRPTDYGYHYMALCERYGGANSQAARDYVGALLLQIGHYAAFLHYLYRLSEEVFSGDALAFTKPGRRKPVFNEDSYWKYLAYIETKLSDELKVMRKVSKRSRERRRTEFQVELTLLRRYGFVNQRRYRLGVGVPIDWIKVQEAMGLDL